MGLKEASLQQNGWHKFPSGLILQWFTVNKNSLANDTSFSQNFPIAFPNLTLQVILSDTSGNTSSGTEGMTITSVDKIAVTVVSSWYSWPASSQPKTNDIRFLAIGY